MIQRSHRYSDDDLIGAAVTAFQASMIPSTDRSTIEPLARGVLAEGPMGINALAREILAIRHGPGAVDPLSSARTTITAALTTSDFPEAIERTARGLARARRTELLEDLLASTAPIIARDYRGTSFSLVDVGTAPLPSAATMSDFWAIRPRLTGEVVQLHSAFAKLLVSLQVVENDDRNFLPSAIAAFVDACHRTELKAIAELLETNPTMADGVELFAAARGNVVTGTKSLILGTGLLAAGMRTLRKQPTESGEPLGARLAIVIAHPDDEAILAGLLQAMPEAMRPRLIFLPLATSTHWYGLADPRLAPVLGRVLLDGADPAGVSFTGTSPASYREPSGKIVDFPGFSIDASHTVGLVALSAVGAVRMSVG